MRAFIAVALPDSVRGSLAELQQQLRTAGADVKWVAREQLHVTLKFLGGITQEQRQGVEALLKDIAKREAPFEISLREVGAFPSVAAPRVIWVGVERGREVVERLATAIERDTQRLEFPAEQRAFSAHVTLGRVRSGRNQRRLTEGLQSITWQPPAPWRAGSLTCYRSTLSPVGPAYDVLAEVRLGA